MDMKIIYNWTKIHNCLDKYNYLAANLYERDKELEDEKNMFIYSIYFQPDFGIHHDY